MGQFCNTIGLFNMATKNEKKIKYINSNIRNKTFKKTGRDKKLTVKNGKIKRRLRFSKSTL